MDRAGRHEQGARELAADEEGTSRGTAIATTDTMPGRSRWRGDRWHPLYDGGHGQGGGMISPNMATLLATIVTDARIGILPARAALQPDVAST